ncbi:MAG: DUF4160 domain-containing protein [Blastocatellia bacterium]|nr:DUF4160 domain-containing protein [Blastocatellia bacterium]
MPTILRHQAYRFYFYSNEPNEPPHIHVDRDNLSAKFWLEVVALARNRGFAARELRQLAIIVTGNQEKFLEAWHEYFDNDR